MNSVDCTQNFRPVGSVGNLATLWRLRLEGRPPQHRGGRREGVTYTILLLFLANGGSERTGKNAGWLFHDQR